jgi:hypothetical protein
MFAGVTDQKIDLPALPTAKGAGFNSYENQHDPRCHPETRVKLLHQITAWADDPQGECIFWLNGMAGTGKSTISRTVAQLFDERKELGASFFFKRGEGDRGHAALFWTTVTDQLIHKLPCLAPHVRSVIEADPAITGKTMRDQFEKLLLQPLGEMAVDPQNPLKVLVVVDALDECDREEDVRVITDLMSQSKGLKSVRLKFFATSRPELPIRLGFEDIRGRYKDLVLQQIPQPIIEHDISMFIHDQLSRIRDEYNKTVPRHRKLPEDWPSQTKVRVLVKMAIPLFIFAATACRFISERRYGGGGPDERLAKILEYQARGQKDNLDATYLPVLDQLLVGITDLAKDIVVKEFRDIVGSIIILASPLSTAALARLIRVPKRVIDDRLDLLHSVLSVPSELDTPVRLLHLSFRDFLLDPEKRKANPFWVDEKESNSKLATHCLQLMSTDDNLKKDICDLQTPGRLRTEVDQQTIDGCLPADVQYACLYWVYHLKESKDMIRDGELVHNFLERHFLHWLEALSLTGRVSESIRLIDELQSVVDVSSDQCHALAIANRKN